MEANLKSDAKQFLVFKLGNHEYGVDIQKITTIIEKDMDIARVPKTPDCIKGVINLRGDIIPVMNLRRKFDMPEVEYTDSTRIIIIKIEDIVIGIIVDEVEEVKEVAEEDIEPITNISNNLSTDYIEGAAKIENRIVTLINLEKLIIIS